MIEWLLAPFTGNGFLARGESGGKLPGAASLISKVASVPSFGDAVADLNAELTRARRYEHPVSLLVMSMHNGKGREASEAGAGGSGGNGSGVLLESQLPHLIALLVASILNEVLRESDILTYDAIADRFVVLLPESDAEKARQAVVRLDRMMRERMLIRIRAGMAVFPEQGLTVSELLEEGETAWTRDPVDPVGSAEAEVEAHAGADVDGAEER